MLVSTPALLLPSPLLLLLSHSLILDRWAASEMNTFGLTGKSCVIEKGDSNRGIPRYARGVCVGVRARACVCVCVCTCVAKCTCTDAPLAMFRSARLTLFWTGIAFAGS